MTDSPARTADGRRRTARKLILLAWALFLFVPLVLAAVVTFGDWGPGPATAALMVVGGGAVGAIGFRLVMKADTLRG
ncbi:hypothetical protein [Dactylosporangium cerinum]